MISFTSYIAKRFVKPCSCLYPAVITTLSSADNTPSTIIFLNVAYIKIAK